MDLPIAPQFTGVVTTQTPSLKPCLTETEEIGILTESYPLRSVVGGPIPVSELFFTNPESPHSHLIPKQDNILWDHKERTVAELVAMDVPQQIAELAVIDFRHMLYMCQRNKLVPFQAARFMYGDVYQLYTRDDGSWHFS